MALLNSSRWSKTVKELDKGAREKSAEGTAKSFSLPHAHLITDNIRRRIQGRIQGGGGPGGQDPPFWGTPKLHKEGKKRRAHVRENAAF